MSQWLTLSDDVILSEGMRVDGLWPNTEGSLYMGRIICVHANGRNTFDIHWSDNTTEQFVTRGRIISYVPTDPVISTTAIDITLPNDESVPSINGSSLQFAEVGTRVEGNYHSLNKWYPGTVTTKHVDGSVDVTYDFGESESFAPVTRLRPLGAADAPEPGQSAHSSAVVPALAAITAGKPGYAVVSGQEDGPTRNKSHEGDSVDVFGKGGDY